MTTRTHRPWLAYACATAAFAMWALNANAAETKAAQSTGTLTIAFGALGNQRMDPTTDSASWGKPWWELMYDYLIGSTNDGKLSKESGVASDWECVNDA